jgi:trk system potassium uptake protein TrkA
MHKKCAVIGLGRFGYHLTKTLYDKGNEVLAIDQNKEVVQKIKDFSTRSVVANATDRDTLEALNIREVDFAVVGLGSPLDHSILVTLHLKEMGIKEIIVKAITEQHGKILQMLGASEIVYPEKDMAIKLATSLSSPNLIDHLTLMDGFSIVELAAPNSFVGKNIKELQLRNEYGVQVIAIKELVPERITSMPTPDFVVKDSDILVIMGSDESLEKVSSVN